jgi:DNA repair exonuclease SbcCD ATPase subunit
MTLITGHNGSGKTTIAEALVYSLYGKPHRKLNLSQLVNVRNKGGLVVEVEFDKCGTSYKVVRGEKPKVFEIWANSTLIESVATVREYQKVLDNIIGMDRKLFTQLVVLEKNDFVPFMALTASDRRKIVEDVLNISIYTLMCKLSVEKTKDVKSIIESLDMDARLKQKDIDNLNGLIEHLESNLETQKREIEDEIKAIQTEIDTQVQSALVVNQTYEEMKRLFDSHGKTKLMAKNQQFIQFKASLDTQVNQENDFINFLKTNDICPTCKQSISQSHVECVLTDKNEKIEKIKAQLDELLTRKTANDDKINEVEQLEQEMIQLKAEIHNWRSKIETSKKNQSNAQAKLVRLTSDIVIGEKKTMLANLQQEMYDINGQKEQNVKLYDALRDIQLALKDDGAKAFVIKQYIPIINDKLNEYLEYMNFPIAFQLDEKFEETFANPARANFVYHNLSNGQKSRVDFAVLLSWLRVAEMKASVSTNLLFIDEMLESFDHEGIDSLMELFRLHFKDKNIFLISQRQNELASHFRNEISFKINDGFTIKVE